MMAAKDEEEEERLRAVALQNAQSILLARRRAEEALRSQSEWLRITLSSIGDAVISTDNQGRVTYMNGVAETLTGWAQAEAAGQPLSEVFHIINEHSRQEVENPALRALKDGVITGLANHTILIARDGTERPIEDSAAPMNDEAGAAIGTVLVFRDITARKLADEDRARLVAIVESSADAIVSKTIYGVIQSWNASAERIFGYTAQEAIGLPITLIVPPERLDEERSILERIRRGERVEPFDTIRVCKDGRRVDISLTVSPLRDYAGQVIGASKIARDITDRKRAELALQEHGRLLKQVAEAGLTIHSAGTLDSLLGVIAEEARRILGARRAIPNLVVADDARNAINADSRSEEHATLSALEGLCAEIRRSNRPLRLTRAEMENHPAWRKASDDAAGRLPLRCWLAAPFVNRGGQNMGLIHVWDKEDSDFSESDEAVLVQLTQIASVAIENARLYGELRDQDRRKDEFLALLAHELRNPLAPLSNGLQVMRLAQGDESAIAESRGMMERQLTHMVRLIDDLLDISRINRNKMELRRARVLLADIVRSAVETVRPAIEAAGHELAMSLPPAPVYLDADLTRLAQVFGNLLSNSAKYTKRGGHIWLTAERRGRHIIVSIRDDGIGIPAGSIRSIFDMFSQVDRSIERSTGGLGIGLALVKGLVEMHGGTVEAESAGSGSGSRFTVRLPALEDKPEGVPGDLAKERQSPSGPRRRILVVDDSYDSAASMAMMLGLRGDEVRTAHNGVEAVEMAAEFRPQVILMDVGMPRLNGYEATRRIREQTWGRDITIIALTGWGQDADKARSQDAGCNGHLVKPVTLADLEKQLSVAASQLSENRSETC